MLKKQSTLQNEKGMAVMEMIPILVIVILLINFSLGFFGIIHTGILNSIAARNYAFETFRHRSNLMYFATNSEGNAKYNYKKDKQRIHATLSEKTTDNEQIKATGRLLDFFELNKRAVEVTGSASDHDTGLNGIQAGKRFQGNGVNPVFVKAAYGICLNTACGD